MKALAVAACLTAVLFFAACAGSLLPSNERAGPENAALAEGEHEVTLRGVRLWYRVAGSGDPGEAPVVFLSGGPGGNSYSFAHIAGPFLESSQRMIYFDQRGTGRSERPPSGDYAIATLVDDIESLRNHLGVPELALIGHSFGAILALEYAAKYPSHTDAVVVAGPLWNAPMSCREQAQRIAEIAPDVHQAMMSGGEPSDQEVCDKVFRAFRGAERERFNERNMFPIAATLERFNKSEAESGLKNTGELSGAVFRQGLLQYRFADLDRVTAPVLVVAGEMDYAAGPDTQRTLAHSLPRGEIAEYAGLGHWMFIDDPERFGRDVSRFLSRTR